MFWSSAKEMLSGSSSPKGETVKYWERKPLSLSPNSFFLTKSYALAFLFLRNHRSEVVLLLILKSLNNKDKYSPWKGAAIAILSVTLLPLLLWLLLLLMLLLPSALGAGRQESRGWPDVGFYYRCDHWGPRSLQLTRGGPYLSCERAWIRTDFR